MTKKKKSDDTVTLVAKAHDVSTAYVRLLIKGERTNRPDILETYNKVLAAKEQLMDMLSQVQLQTQS